MDSSQKRPFIGVGVAALRNGKVLLGKRKGAHGAGNWSFAGGHLEFFESVEECARRELIEETGLKAFSLKLGPWTEDLIEEKHYVTLFVFASHLVGEPKLLEPHKCDGWGWFTWDTLPTPLFSPIRSLIAKIGLKNLEKIAKTSSESD